MSGFNDFDKGFNRTVVAIVIAWIVSVLVAATVAGVAIWGIVELVRHVTGG